MEWFQACVSYLVIQDEYRYLTLLKFCHTKRRVVFLHLNEGDKWHRYYFFKVATAGVLDYISQHLLSQVKQFTSIFKRFLTIALRWHFLYYVRGLCRMISKKSSKCIIWLNKISPNLMLILKSDSSSCLISCFKYSVKICEHS